MYIKPNQITERAIVFVHIPRTAGRSMERYFLSLAGTDWKDRRLFLLGYNAERAAGPPVLAHLTAREYVECGHLSASVFARSFKFAFVRNPYARLVSVWRYQRVMSLNLRHFKYNPLKLLHARNWRHRHSFRDFVLKYFPAACDDDYKTFRDWRRHVTPQSQFLLDASGECLVDFVGKFEDLQNDFCRVQNALGLQPAELPHIQSPHFIRLSYPPPPHASVFIFSQPPIRARIATITTPKPKHSLRVTTPKILKDSVIRSECYPFSKTSRARHKSSHAFSFCPGLRSRYAG